MAFPNTTFISQVTTITAQWLQAVNDWFVQNFFTITVDSISSLRTVSSISRTRAFVTGYYSAGDGGGGHYWYDPSDTTSTDNGGTIIVATDGGRWKFSKEQVVTVLTFGADPTAGSSSLTHFNAALDYAVTQTVGGIGYVMRVPHGVYLINGPVALRERVTLVGDGIRSTIIALSGTTASFVADGITSAGVTHMRIGLQDGVDQKAITIKTTSADMRWCVFSDLEIASGIPRDQHYGIHAVASGGRIVTENSFSRIRTFNVNRPIYRADIEGNSWNDLQLAEHGKAVACAAIDGASNADYYQGRVAGTTLDGSIGYKNTAARNIVNVLVDIGGGTRKALSLLGIGEVVAVSRPELLTPLGDVGTSNTIIDGGTVISGLQATTGPSLSAANFSLSSEWGNTATVNTVVGNDSRVTFTVSSSGTGQALYPTVTFSNTQGGWPGGADIIPQVTRNGGNQDAKGTFSATGTATGWSFRFIATPVAGESYVFTVTV